MISNANVYLAIAEEALAESQNLDSLARSPRPDRQPGSVIAYDPQRKSFKQSLIALTFAGVYFEALLYLVGVARLGKNQWLRIDGKCYEEKLLYLGISDEKLLAECKRFRVARNDLVHEKAVEAADIGRSNLHWGQKEAEHGVSFVKRVTVLLQRFPNQPLQLHPGADSIL